jgi:hypothetical protein
VRDTAVIAFTGPTGARGTAVIASSTTFSAISSATSSPPGTGEEKATLFGLIVSAERAGDLFSEAFVADFVSCDGVGDDGGDDDDDDDDDDVDLGLVVLLGPHDGGDDDDDDDDVDLGMVMLAKL